MKRQYQFSVDSFQIILDPLLNFFNQTRKIYIPTITVLSSYGNFSQALQHLHHRLIDVKAPEELRGGGLLKYCDLIARGFHPTNQTQMKDLQRYMCSRFFIDFRDSLTQEQVLSKYVTSHFGIDYDVRYRFLRCLYDVISTDSVWLSGFERICFLRTISIMSSCDSSYFNNRNIKQRYDFDLFSKTNSTIDLYLYAKEIFNKTSNTICTTIEYFNKIIIIIR